MTDNHDTPQEESQETSQQAQAGPEETPETQRAEIGRRLRQAREQRGLGIDEIARELKLRAAYLTAMEDGDWSALPGDVYGVAFARQYARYLGLDLEQDIARVSSDEYQLTKPLTFPDPPIAPAKRWALTAALLFILLFIGFNVFHSAVHKHEQASGPAVLHPASPPPVAKAKKPKPAQPAPAANRAATSPAPTTTTPAPAKPTEKPAQPAPAPAAAMTATTPAPVQALAPAAPATTDHRRKGAHRYRFVAVGGDVWLQLYSGPNDLVKEALLRQGQHMDIDTDATSLLMDCGNAGAIQISIDGKPAVSAGQLGPIGKVIRDYTLKVPAP